MNKKLEDLFDLPSDDNTEEESSTELSKLPTDEMIEELESSMTLNQKINSAFPHLKNLGDDSGLDDISERALDSYENLMDMGMNVDSRFSARLFEVAGQMLGHAYNAENSKTQKKLKILELQLRKLRIDQQGKSYDDAEEAQGHELDRNELIEKLKDSINTDNDPGN